jgi:hypothetical protein
MRALVLFLLVVGCADLPCGESAGPPLLVGDNTCVLVRSATPGVELTREPDSCAPSSRCLVVMPGETIYVYEPNLSDDGRVYSETTALLDGKCPLSCD